MTSMTNQTEPMYADSKEQNLYPDARFWNRISRRYARKLVPDQKTYETKLAKTNGYLEPADRVLEIGCGTGTTAIHHAPRVAHILATDISSRMIEIARAKARAANIQNIDFDVTNIDDLDTEPGSIDVVLAHSVLHLVPSVGAALNRLHQMVRPDGLLVSSVPCIRDVFPAYRYVGPIGRVLGLLPRVNVFGEVELNRWFTAAGFTIEERWQPRPRGGVYIVARKLSEADKQEKGTNGESEDAYPGITK